MIKILAVQKTGRAKTQKLLSMMVSSGRLARRGVCSSEKSKDVKKKKRKKSITVQNLKTQTNIKRGIQHRRTLYTLTL